MAANVRRQIPVYNKVSTRIRWPYIEVYTWFLPAPWKAKTWRGNFMP